MLFSAAWRLDEGERIPRHRQDAATHTMARSSIRFELAVFAYLTGHFGVAAAPSPATESVEQALCRLIEASAVAHNVPLAVFTKLIWQESSFRIHVISPAGAQGVAQFMPDTARERGLSNPFDPEQAIPKAAEFIAHLKERFGNFGLAAAAYNAGPARVSSWLAGQGVLPLETRSYVLSITGKNAEEWASDKKQDPDTTPASSDANAHSRQEAEPVQQSCLELVALLRRPGTNEAAETPFAPWGVQLAGNFSKQQALATYARASKGYASVLGEIPPMVIGTRLRNRGTRTFYRVRVPAATRNEANALCDKIRKVGGSCIVLPS